jgi:hypothetical protein
VLVSAPQTGPGRLKETLLRQKTVVMVSSRRAALQLTAAGPQPSQDFADHLTKDQNVLVAYFDARRNSFGVRFTPRYICVFSPDSYDRQRAMSA